MARDTTSQNILITGATGGLGKALALECAGRGAQTILMDRNKRLLERLCDEVEARGAPAPGYVDIDIAKLGPEEVSELVAGLTDAYGELDAIIHAAVRFDGLHPIDQVPTSDWLLDLQVNLNAPWLLTVACLPSLRRSKGSVVFFLDDNARGQAYWGSYGVAKGAIAALAETLKVELEAVGCRVLAIDPGPMRTDLRAAAYIAEDPASVPLPTGAAQRVVDQLFTG